MQKAGQAEIIRASQRDSEFVLRAQNELKNIVQFVKGDAWWLKWHRHLDVMLEYFYFLLTTIDGSQTLGEEYAGLVQVYNGSIPSRLRRVLMCSLHVLTPPLVDTLLSRLACGKFDASCPMPVRRLLPTLVLYARLLHTCMFYLGGGFYDYAKRLAAVRYLMVRSWMAFPGGRFTFRLLGVLCGLQLLVISWHVLRSLRRHHRHTGRAAGQDDGTRPRAAARLLHFHCALCMSEAEVPSALPCGHVTCWQCGSKWLRVQSQCPVCRAATSISRLVPLII